MLKRPKLPSGFQGRGFKGKLRGVCGREPDLLGAALCSVDGEVTG